MEKRKRLTITVIDLIFALLLEQFFTEYLQVTSSIGFFLFFFTFGTILISYYNYREWHSKLENYEEAKEHTIPTLVLDIVSVFLTFQLIVSINLGVEVYFYWFILIQFYGIIWNISYLILFHKHRDLRIQNTFGVLRSILITTILSSILILGKTLSDWDYVWIIVTTFVGITIMNISFQSWDRFKPKGNLEVHNELKTTS